MSVIKIRTKIHVTGLKKTQALKGKCKDHIKGKSNEKKWVLLAPNLPKSILDCLE